MLQGSSSIPTPASTFFARVNSVNRSASFNEGSGDIPEEEGGGAEGGDVRRARSMRVPGAFGGTVHGRRDVSGGLSFAAAGSNLSSPAPSEVYTPPAASRHPLFSHHALPITGSPTFASDPGPSGPPSPSSSSGAFSPASAFLSHFSSSNSLRVAPSLPPDSMGARVGDYILGKVVGRGGFSTVRKCTHVVTGEAFACKIVKRDDLSDRSGSLEKFEEEVRIWGTLPHHPSLLPLIETHRTPAMTFLITPYLSGGSLLDVLKRENGSEKTASKWFPGIVAAVSALHEGFDGFEGGMLHGDLKLDNFLVDHAGKVMVGDFYMAQKISNPIMTIPPPMSRSRRASPSPYRSFEPAQTQNLPSASLPYAPPELLRAPPCAPSLAQDIWSLGIILHALLTGRLPFVDQFDPRLQMKILRGSWEVPNWIGKEWIECLTGCLDGNMKTRWDIGRVCRCDALVGWREVKHRSKSRSRSRARGRSNSRLHAELMEPRRPDSAQPLPILTPRRGQSREPRSDRFSLPESRSRSSSVNTRSRRQSSSHVFDFSPDITEDTSPFENISITRGRSTAKKINPETLTFTRSARSISSNRIPGTAPAYLDTFDNSSRSRSRHRHSDSPGSLRTPQDSESPSASRSSRSRSRASPVTSAEYLGYEYRGELGVVDEEGNRKEVDRGRAHWERGGDRGIGRSRSRGRPDR